MGGIGHALMLMHCNSDLDELWTGICCLSSGGFVQLIASVFTRIYIYRDKIMNDVEEYVKLLRWREKEREREGCYREWLRVGELSKWLYACE